ncbi:hypothetical protein [Herbiconiux sp. L3-i23]|uniref:hypothetical protein n=1 Tax=Herbiconiux sp. L3-i23 TaxID=2905871 RepID=UPI00205CCC29|nr:hypothetical protein [Herbiconiux sp. L3-i23]BDI21649.1 hypothetical protein L3i23_04250 [Herbiconiux sp. L3-i23]
MKSRDAIYSGYDNVFVFGGLAQDAMSRLGPALHSLLRTSDAVRVPSGADLDLLVARSITDAGDGLSERDLIIEAHRRGYAGLPLAITVSGNSIAVMLRHSVFDGSGAIEAIGHLAAVAAGAPAPEPDRRPLAKRATAALLTVLNRASLDAFRRAQHDAHSVVSVTPPHSDLAHSSESAGFVAFELDDDDQRTLMRAKERGRKGRSSKNTRIASIGVSALRAVQRGDADMPVSIPIDLRHLVDGRVRGNFVSVMPFGSLQTTDWAPSAITARLAALSASNAPAVSLLIAVYRRGRDRLKSVLRRAPYQPGYAVSISLLNSKLALPETLWAGRGSFGCATIGPWPSATFVFVATMGGTPRVSVWDESGLFDLTRFERAFRDELESRAALAP